MYWMIFLVLALICALLNPYVGLVGLLFIEEIMVYLFLDENIQKAASFMASYVDASESKYYELLKKSGKGLLNLWCVLAIFFFAGMTALTLVVWIFASGRLSGTVREMTPFVLFGDDHKMLCGTILLVGEIVFHLIALILIFVRRSEILKMPKEIKPWKTLILKEEHPANRLDHIRVKMGFLPLFLILAAGIFGMLNGYFGWLSFLLHFMYLLLIVVLELIVAVMLRLLKKNDKVKQGTQYFINYVLDGTPYYQMVLGAVWIVTAVIVILQMILSLSYKRDIFMIFSLDMGLPALIISCVLEIVAAWCITINLLKKDRSEEKAAKIQSTNQKDE